MFRSNSTRALALAPFAIGLARHALEIGLGNSGTVRWTPASVSDTVLYAYFVAYVPLALLLALHRPSENARDILTSLALPFTAAIHLIAPIGNALFNYHGPHWPEVHRSPWLLTPLYFPVGSMLGFLFAFVFGAFWIRRALGLSWRATLGTVLVIGTLEFFFCYQVAGALAFGPSLRVFFPSVRPTALPDWERPTHFYNAVLSLGLVPSVFLLFRRRTVALVGASVALLVVIASLAAAYL